MKVIVVTGRKGGSGKTTIAVNMACTLPGPAVLIDGDPQESAAEWMEGRDSPTVLTATDTGDLERIFDRIPMEEKGLVVVDCPPLDAHYSGAAVRRADLVLLPVIPSILDLRSAAPVIDALLEIGRPFLVVLNRTKPRVTATDKARSALEGMGAKVAKTELGDRVAHVEAAVFHQSIVEHSKRSKAAVEIKALAREVSALMK